MSSGRLELCAVNVGYLLNWNWLNVCIGNINQYRTFNQDFIVVEWIYKGQPCLLIIGICFIMTVVSGVAEVREECGENKKCRSCKNWCIMMYAYAGGKWMSWGGRGGVQRDMSSLHFYLWFQSLVHFMLFTEWASIIQQHSSTICMWQMW